MSLRKTRFPGVYRYVSKKKGKGDVYRAKIYDPTAPSGQRWLGTFPTAREAHAAKREAEQEGARRRDSKVPAITNAQYAEVWLDRHPRGRSSISTYRASIKPFVEEFGDRLLGDLTRAEARDWAVTAPHSHVRTARTMLNDAIDDELLSVNPFSSLKIPQGQGRRYEEPPSAEEVLDLASRSAESGSPWGPLMRDVLLFGFGSLMRPNEICSLRPEDVDFKHKAIRVTWGMDRWGTLTETKTKRRSVIALTPLAEQALERLSTYLPAGRETLFVTPSGDAPRTQTLDSYFRELRGIYAGIRNDARFRKLTLYLCTRHAGAAFMRNVLGIRPDDIQMQLRHQSSNLLDLYTHPSERPAIDRILAAWPDDLGEFLQVGP